MVKNRLDDEMSESVRREYFLMLYMTLVNLTSFNALTRLWEALIMITIGRKLQNDKTNQLNCNINQNFLQ